jgi:hypothetical protein
MAERASGKGADKNEELATHQLTIIPASDAPMALPLLQAALHARDASQTLRAQLGIQGERSQPGGGRVDSLGSTPVIVWLGMASTWYVGFRLLPASKY